MNYLIYRLADQRIIGGFSISSESKISVLPEPYKGFGHAIVSTANYEAAMSQLDTKSFVVQFVDGVTTIAPYTPPRPPKKFFAELDKEGRVSALRHDVLPERETAVEIAEADYQAFIDHVTRPDDRVRQLIVVGGRIEKIADSRPTLVVTLEKPRFAEDEPVMVSFSYDGTESQLPVTFYPSGAAENVLLELDGGMATIELPPLATGQYRLGAAGDYKISGDTMWEVQRVWKTKKSR